jgi:hypothetical protein
VQSIVKAHPPTLGVDWWMQWGSKDGLPTSLSKLQLETAQRHADTNTLLRTVQRRPLDLEKVLGLVATIKALLQEFENLIALLPLSWQFSTAAWIAPIDDRDIESAKEFPGKVDHYLDVSVATAWNMTRAARLILWSDLARLNTWLCNPYQNDYRLLPEYQEAKTETKFLIEDIIASVPLFLGGASVLAGGTTAPAALALFIIWPLFLVKISDFATEAQKRWIVARFRYIAFELGILEADAYAKVRMWRLLKILEPEQMANAMLSCNVVGASTSFHGHQQG